MRRAILILTPFILSSCSSVDGFFDGYSSAFIDPLVAQEEYPWGNLEIRTFTQMNHDYERSETIENCELKEGSIRLKVYKSKSLENKEFTSFLTNEDGDRIFVKGNTLMKNGEIFTSGVVNAEQAIWKKCLR